jgi:LacI family transcriptional regulator
MVRRVTMADVAREAGVSLMTVSRALNGKEGISDATRVHIQEVIGRLGYRPSSIARGLVTKRTGTIGLVVPDNSNPYFSEVARGVEHTAYANNYSVFLCNTEEDPQREKAVLHSLAEKYIDGLVLCSSRLAEDDLRECLKDFSAQVLVNRLFEYSAASMVLAHDEEGARLGVGHLLRSGHRAIGMLAGPERSYGAQMRVKGYTETLSKAGVSLNPRWIQHCSPTVDASQQAAVELLTRHPELTALVCHNDLVAVGALKACRQLGRAVPDDLAIVGFDDIPLASLVTPPLTTIHVQRYEMGLLAGETLMAQIKGETIRSVHLLPVSLVIRGSAP